YYLSGQSASVSQDVVADGTNVTLATSATTAYVGDSITFSATVAPANALDPSATVPAGKVDFYDGNNPLGSSALTGSTARFSTTSLLFGLHSITATYVSNNGLFSGSSSPVSIETVNQITPMITWSNPADIVYGTALSNTQLNATATDQHNGGIPVLGTFTYNPALGAVLPAGQLNLSAKFTPTDAATYASTTATATINIVPATLTITPDNVSRTYGATNPTFTFHYSGFVNNEDPTVVVATQPTCSTTATGASSIGQYPITCSGGVVPNYTLTYQNGTLTIDPASLTITADDRIKTFGQTVTFAGTEFTTNNLVNSDSVSRVTLASAGSPADAGVAGSPYSITASNAVGTGLGNYTINYADGSLIVNKADAIVSVTPYSVTYDGDPHTATGSVKGVLGEVLTGLDLSGTAHTHAGNYNGDAWTFTDSTGNYNNAAGNVNDTIAKADPLVSATAGTFTYDGNPHAGSGAATGVKGENLTPVNIAYKDAGGNLLISPPVNAGTYSVAARFAGDNNYNPKQSAAAQLIINKAEAVITVTPYSVTYDGNPHTATGTAVGVETPPADLSSMLHLSGTTHTSAGDYATDPWTFDGDNNY